MALSAADLAGCRGAIAAILPDTAALYDNAGVSVVQASIGVRRSNDRSLVSRRDSSDFTSLVAAYGTPLATGLTVLYSTAWYVIAKVRMLTGYTLELQAMLLPLPYTLTVTRVQPAAVPMPHRNGYGEPRTPAGVSETTRTILAGFSNDNDPLAPADIGAMPKGVTTIYTPLGSDVILADQITLPDGRLAVVQQKNLMDANAQGFAYQLLIDASGGEGAM